jgi:hypothetical protein
MVEREQIRPGDLLRLTRPYTIGHVTSGQQIVVGSGACITILAMVDEGEERGHIALFVGDDRRLHRVAAWWLEINSELLAAGV